MSMKVASTGLAEGGLIEVTVAVDESMLTDWELEDWALTVTLTD